MSMKIALKSLTMIGVGFYGIIIPVAGVFDFLIPSDDAKHKTWVRFWRVVFPFVWVCEKMDERAYERRVNANVKKAEKKAEMIE